MAYAGSTSGSSVANPPALTEYTVAGSTNTGSTDAYAWQQYVYRSTHTQAEVAAAGFFTDGQALGMKVGNSVMVIGGATSVISQHRVTAVSSTGATVSAGLLVSSAS